MTYALGLLSVSVGVGLLYGGEYAYITIGAILLASAFLREVRFVLIGRRLLSLADDREPGEEPERGHGGRMGAPWN